jgi:PPOX class probable F420-dependent enzyme
MPTASAALLALGDQRFVELTTFRRSGEGAPTTVWIARDGDALVVTTPDDSGKVKRLRHTGRVTLRPCSRMGKVTDDAPLVEAVGALEPVTPRLASLFSTKYGLEYRIFLFIERIAARRHSEPKQKPRVIVRIR